MTTRRCPRRDPRRLGRDRGDGHACRDGRRAAVPRPRVRGHPPPADHLRERLQLPPRARAGAGRWWSTRSSTRATASQMRILCKRYRLHYCDVLGHPIDAVARVSGLSPKGEPARGAGPRLELLQASRGDRVRRPGRRRRRSAAARGGRHRSRRCLANVQDPALDLPRLPRLQGCERPDRQGDRAATGALRDRSGDVSSE